MPTRFSDESLGAEWLGDERGVGAVFTGRNHHPAVGEWTLPCIVDAYDEPTRLRLAHLRPRPPRAPGGASTSSRPPVAPGCGSATSMGPGPSGTTMAITANPGKEARVLRRRLDEVQANMQRTVEGIKELAESLSLSHRPGGGGRGGSAGGVLLVGDVVSQVTTWPLSSASWMATCAMNRSAVAPCQCSSSGSM